jgi:nucleoside-diphosphate-sugar epimerase
MGGSRFMGLAVVERLLQGGHEVATFNRGTRSVPWNGTVQEVIGDRDDPDAVAKLSALRLDGIIDLSAYTADQTRKLLMVQGDVGRHVHISSGAIYAPQPLLPWAEDTPQGPWPLWGTYAAEKLASEHVLAAHRPRDAATTVLRFPFVLGPRNYADREEFVLNRLLDRVPLLLPGDGKAVQQFLSVDQAAEAMVHCLETFDTGGTRAFNIASPALASLEGFVYACARVAGVEPLYRVLGSGPTGTTSTVFNPVDCVFPFPNENYILDLRASERAGVSPAPVRLDEMITRSLEALLDDPSRRAWRRTLAESAAL